MDFFGDAHGLVSMCSVRSIDDSCDGGATMIQESEFAKFTGCSFGAERSRLGGMSATAYVSHPSRKLLSFQLGL